LIPSDKLYFVQDKHCKSGNVNCNTVCWRSWHCDSSMWYQIYCNNDNKGVKDI